jgi:UDP-N-acetylglucosamine--N-acetylmuramyl-(pentapeptide) pyrophosphoryl-undecaprenol N-acetylglucosamine transferase
MVRIAFLGGGTGGHLAPGVAVAQELRARGHEVVFLIAGRPVERALLDPRGLPTRELFGDRARPSPFDLPSWWTATARWRRAVREDDPQAIVVLGGWVAMPAVVTGFFGRPSVLIEQNLRAGKVQRLLGGRVEHACLAGPGEDMPRGRRSTRVTGNPAPALPRIPRAEAAARFGLQPQRRTLLLMGGSQGAGDLNALLPALSAVLAEQSQDWQVLNVTGGQPASLEGLPSVPVVRQRFIEDMAAAYSVADVAVCRAGGSTVAELANTGTPSVLVPFPHHADHHQEANGRPLVEAGAAFMTARDDPAGRRTAAAFLRLALPRLHEMSEAARRVGRPDAAREVAEVVLDAAGGAS